MSVSGSPYLRLTLRLPAELEDLLVAELWTLGTLGSEVRGAGAEELVVEAYFDARQRPELVARRAFWRRLGAELLELRELPARDWLAAYRRRARPFALGSRFWVDPAEPGAAAAAPDGRTLLELPARAAFGTGSHESTRLVVEWLEECPPLGLRVLDVGCGTGILGFVALHLRARSVVGIDLDREAAFAAGENRRRNRLPLLVAAATPAALATRASFDLALVNMTIGSLRPCLPRLGRLLRPGGGAFFSGALAAQEEDLRRLLVGAGFEPRAVRARGEWQAVHAVLRIGGGASA